MDFFKISVILFGVALFFQTIIVYYLCKLVVTFLNRFRITGGSASADALKVGEVVPFFREYDQLKRPVKLNSDTDKYTLLVFASNGCGYCKEIIPKLGDLKFRFDLNVLVVSEEYLEIHKENDINFIKSKLLFENYLIKSAPTILLIDPSQHLVSYLDIRHSHGLNIILENYFRNTKDSINVI